MKDGGGPLSSVSLRDYFAAMAMQGLIAGGAIESVNLQVPDGTLRMRGLLGVPMLAYLYADAMIKARQQPQAGSTVPESQDTEVK